MQSDKRMLDLLAVVQSKPKTFKEFSKKLTEQGA